jgi:hypothetical protein
MFGQQQQGGGLFGSALAKPSGGGLFSSGRYFNRDEIIVNF